MTVTDACVKPKPASWLFTGVRPGMGVLVGVFVGVFVAVFVGVFVAVLVGVFVGEFVGVLVGVLVGVFVAVLVGVFVGVFVGVRVGVLVFVAGTIVLVAVLVGVFVAVLVGVRVGVVVLVGVAVPPQTMLFELAGFTVCPPSWAETLTWGGVQFVIGIEYATVWVPESPCKGTRKKLPVSVDALLAPPKSSSLKSPGPVKVTVPVKKPPDGQPTVMSVAPFSIVLSLAAAA